MKTVILAGGLGTRLSEETAMLPKPMVEVGGRPLLWHIMQIYSAHGLNDFVLCCGYKGHVIKDYFHNYFLRSCDFTIDLRERRTVIHHEAAEPWTVTMVDTGQSTMTGGRLGRVREHLGGETFCLTYGDGVSDIDLTALVAFHRAHGKGATVTATQPQGRFGALSFASDERFVSSFTEKPVGDNLWINAGFFVLEPMVLDYLGGDDTIWEQAPMRRLAADGQLAAYRHTGFWQCVDTVKDKQTLEALWSTGRPPWLLNKP